MNVLFLSELIYPHGSGAELATYLYAKLLSQEGFKTVVITNRFANEPSLLKNENLAICRLPLFAGSQSFRYSTLARFDVLFSNYFRKMIEWADVVYVPRFWFSAISTAKRYGKPVIVHLHDYVPICPLSSFYDVSKTGGCRHTGPICPPECIYAFEKIQGRNVKGTLLSIALNPIVGRYLSNLSTHGDAIICVSSMQKDILTKKEPLLRGKTYVVYNPMPEFSNTQIRGDDFGYFGGSDYLKGFCTLYQALIDLRGINRPSITIHATKFLTSSTQSTQFESSLEKSGLVLYGKLGKGDYEKVYEKVRAVIVPSLWQEPWPYVVVEALIQGRFVIASHAGGIPEQVDGCKGALLCETGNHSELANAIDFVSGLETEAIIDLGLQNKETFLRRFDNKKTIKKFINILESVI